MFNSPSHAMVVEMKSQYYHKLLQQCSTKIYIMTETFLKIMFTCFFFNQAIPYISIHPADYIRISCYERIRIGGETAAPKREKVTKFATI